MARKTRRAKAPAKRTKKALAPVTPGIRTVTPYLFMNGAAKAIEFYKKAFGAKEIDRSPMPDGTLMHATVKIGDSIVMMSDAFPGGDSSSPSMAGTTTVSLHIYSKDVDKLWNQAVNAGAVPLGLSTRPPWAFHPCFLSARTAASRSSTAYTGMQLGAGRWSAIRSRGPRPTLNAATWAPNPVRFQTSSAFRTSR